MSTDKPTNQTQPKTNTRRGRPTKSQGPAVPWNQVDRILVHGENVESELGSEIRFPSFREIAKRYGVAHSLVAKYAKQHSCIHRRQQSQKLVKELSDDKLVSLRSSERALKTDDLVQTIERYLAQFDEAVIEGRVRCDNPSDYNLMARLRKLLLGDVEARTELICNVSLEELQRRHLEMLSRADDATLEMLGMVTPPQRAQTESDRQKREQHLPKTYRRYDDPRDNQEE